MLSRHYRLPAPLIPHFQGQVVQNRSVKIIFQATGQPHFRLAAIISKRVHPLAVKRHHVKRLIHQVFASHHLSRAFDFLVIPNPVAPTLRDDQFSAQLSQLLESIINIPQPNA